MPAWKLFSRYRTRGTVHGDRHRNGAWPPKNAASGPRPSALERFQRLVGGRGSIISRRAQSAEPIPLMTNPWGTIELGVLDPGGYLW
jgi:hypothetical protein